MVEGVRVVDVGKQRYLKTLFATPWDSKQVDYATCCIELIKNLFII
jgi:hypothetical protein